jgi:short-subunit dehydrogenase
MQTLLHQPKSSQQKIVLATGASSGFGRAIATLLTEAGLTVFGTSRNPDPSITNNFELLPLDVCSDDSVNTCIQTILQRTNRLDVLINNAGYATYGAIEETCLSEAKSQFETNFFGVVRLIQTVLPIMRQQGSGRIINISSLSGLNPVPFHGFYSASKHALEAYSEALHHEVKSHSIQVSLVEPQAFNTNIQMQSPQHLMSIYDADRQKVVDNIEASIRTGQSPTIVAHLVLRILRSPSPRLRYRAGTLAKAFHLARRFLPEPVYEQILRHHFNLNTTSDGFQPNAV